MQIDNEQQYQDAVTELKLLEERAGWPTSERSSDAANWKRPPRSTPNS